MKTYLRKALVSAAICTGILTALTSGRIAAGVQGNVPSDRQAILAADYSLEEAIAKGNRAGVEQLLDANFEWTAPTGKTWTRAEVLQNVRVLTGENGDLDQSGLTERYYSGQVGVLYRLTHEPRYTHIWVKRPVGWRAFIFFDTPNPPPGRSEPAPDPRPDLKDPEATTNCINPCKSVPWTPKTEQEKEVIASWQRQKETERLPDSQEAINAWATRSHDDGMLIYPAQVTHYQAYRLSDLIRMWKNGVRAPGGPYVVSMHMYTFGKDCVIFTAHQHPSEHVTKPDTYAVRIWVTVHPPFYGIVNPNPLPWEFDHIWQIALSQSTGPIPK
ncbi:MAG: nuclear transport factor 2 family protein [Candidatus Acidiferrales bacterium]